MKRSPLKRSQKPMKRTPMKRSRKRIKPVSEKRKKINEQYKVERIKFLTDKPVCEVCRVAPSTDVHHKAGRIGDNMFKHWLACCRLCHQKIEENPKWALENGYMMKRFSSETLDKQD